MSRVHRKEINFDRALGKFRRTQAAQFCVQPTSLRRRMNFIFAARSQRGDVCRFRPHPLHQSGDIGTLSHLERLTRARTVRDWLAPAGKIDIVNATVQATLGVTAENSSASGMGRRTSSPAPFALQGRRARAGHLHGPWFADLRTAMEFNLKAVYSTYRDYIFD